MERPGRERPHPSLARKRSASTLRANVLECSRLSGPRYELASGRYLASECVPRSPHLGSRQETIPALLRMSLMRRTHVRPFVCPFARATCHVCARERDTNEAVRTEGASVCFIPRCAQRAQPILDFCGARLSILELDTRASEFSMFDAGPDLHPLVQNATCRRA